MFDFINECASRIGSAAISGLRGFGFGSAAILVLCTPLQAKEKCRAEAILDVLREDAALLQLLIDWQEHLIRVEMDDPKKAKRHLLPHDICRFSVLASACDDLTTLFEQRSINTTSNTRFLNRYELRDNDEACEN